MLAMAYIFILCSHRTLGGWQFGNRYFKDIMPWLFAMLCLTAPDSRRLRRIVTPLFFAALALHAVGTVMTWNGLW